MLGNIFLRLLQKWPHRDIIVDEDLYLRRYYLLKLPGFAIYLHRIYRSDSDRHLHTHPWHFLSIVLWGGYLEHTLAQPEGIRRKRFSPAWRSRIFAHRLTLTAPLTTTLVLRFGFKPHPWGFHTERGWIHWREYCFNTDPAFKRSSAPQCENPIRGVWCE